MENRCGFHESLTQQVSLRSQDLESWIPGSKADNNQLDCPSAVTIMRRKMKYYASPELGALGNDLIGINQAGANPKQPSKAPFLLKTGQNLCSDHRNDRSSAPGGPVGCFECRLAKDRRGNVVPVAVAGWCWFNGENAKRERF